MPGSLRRHWEGSYFARVRRTVRLGLGLEGLECRVQAGGYLEGRGDLEDRVFWETYKNHNPN